MRAHPHLWTAAAALLSGCLWNPPAGSPGPSASAGGTGSTGSAASASGGTSASTGGPASSTGGTSGGAGSTGGAAGAVTLAGGYHGAGPIAVAGPDLFWVEQAGGGASGGPLYQAAADGSGAALVARGSAPGAVAVGSASLYWQAGQAMEWLDFGRNAATPGFPTNLAWSVESGGRHTVATNSQAFFWVGQDAQSGLYQVMSQLQGWASGWIWVLSSRAPYPALAADEVNLYWIELGAPAAWSEQGVSGSDAVGRIMKGTLHPLSGDGPSVDNPTPLATGVLNPVDLVTDGVNVYWLATGHNAYTSGVAGAAPEGVVMSVPVGGGPAVTLASGQNNPFTLATDGRSVFFSNEDPASKEGSVQRVPVGGGAVTPIADHQQGPHGIALDGQFIYWTNAYDAVNSIMRAGK